jgi:hypothetical protein
MRSMRPLRLATRRRRTGSGSTTGRHPATWAPGAGRGVDALEKDDVGGVAVAAGDGVQEGSMLAARLVPLLLVPEAVGREACVQLPDQTVGELRSLGESCGVAFDDVAMGVG